MRGDAAAAARLDLQPGAVRRVLMTADAVGGVWRYTLDLAQELGSLGVEVHVACMGPPPADDQRAEAARLDIAVSEAPYALEWMDEPWADVDRAGDWLRRQVDRFDPDVLHLNGYAHAALGFGVPTLVVAHSCVRSWWRAVHGCEAPPKWARYREVVTAGLRAADAVIVPTRALALEIESDYGPFRRMGIIPNGTKNLAWSDGRAAREPLVLTAGRLWDEAKNVSALCAAAPRLSWPVYLAGPMGDGGQPSCADTVRRLGRLSRQEMASWYERASIYALPARYEPFGLSVLEAASAGCALVLGDIATLRENWTGAADFVAPDDVDGLAAAIERLIADPWYRLAQSRRARRRARRFTIDRMAAAYLTLYRELAGARAPRQAAGTHQPRSSPFDRSVNELTT
jgi:glycosyltransferase involved in cell wall biosynthesis